MSITGFSDSDKIYKKATHRKNDSGELDVFEAARYFSGSNEASSYNGAAFPHEKPMREEKQVCRGGRMRLDMPMKNQLPLQSHRVEKQMKEKKYKQPSSPGGRLASFLNSLFNQTSSKKKKAKSTTQSVKDEEESPGGRRKRRSSISHVPSFSTADSKSIYSSSSSGFRTPPPYANTPTKVYKDIRSNSDHKQGVSLSKYNEQGSKASQNNVLDEKRSTDLAWLDEKIKLSDGFSEKNKNLKNNGISEKDRIWIYQYPLEKDFRRFNEVDDGGESDSSSDLFELQNCDLGCYSSGLPVYETTHLDSIKRGAPITNGPL
ncbi:hypothetical protein HHK36_015523 [Tetracentron sinense]|uniref:Protein BIG GRAIN 1-like E n=1 Tax=Tetracentron sinense TaxID=13715 RepID=A0A834Z7C3_TETSI|nr:hypothetical protein HHK36_015523 [Tetracentron sinense]